MIKRLFWVSLTLTVMGVALCNAWRYWVWQQERTVHLPVVRCSSYPAFYVSDQSLSRRIGQNGQFRCVIVNSGLHPSQPAVLALRRSVQGDAPPVLRIALAKPLPPGAVRMTTLTVPAAWYGAEITTESLEEIR